MHALDLVLSEMHALDLAQGQEREEQEQEMEQVQEQEQEREQEQPSQTQPKPARMSKTFAAQHTPTPTHMGAGECCAAVRCARPM